MALDEKKEENVWCVVVVEKRADVIAFWNDR